MQDAKNTELLKEIIDLPHGEARKVLRDKGLWREGEGCSEDAVRYVVTFEGYAYVRVEGVGEVYAETDDEAEMIADKLLHHEIDWDFVDIGVNSETVDHWEIASAIETP